jgi:predicted MFS family arabinose efflux permease
MLAALFVCTLFVTPTDYGGQHTFFFFLLCNLQGLFGCLPWGMILVFLNDFLAQNKGLSVQQSTFVLLVLGVGGGIGVVGGGWLGQWLYNRWKWSMSLFIGSATVVGTLPLAYLVNADVAAHPPLTLFMALMAGLLSGTVGPNMR